MTTLTASDIAKHIQRPDEPLTAAVDRLRTWTKMGIIKPAGERNPGTGRKKQYSSVALLEAMVLQAITDTFGSPAISLSPLVKQVSSMVRLGALMVYKSPASPRQQVLVIDRSRNGTLTIYPVELKELAKYISSYPLDVYMVLNIANLFERLPFDLADVFPTLRSQPKISKKSKPDRK
jgi:hypothetical protein